MFIYLVLYCTRLIIGYKFVKWQIFHLYFNSKKINSTAVQTTILATEANKL